MKYSQQFPIRSTNLLMVLALFLPPAAFAEEAPEAEGAERPFATSLFFAFHSDPEVGLHHFLYRWAWIEAMEAGTVRKWFPQPTLRGTDKQGLDALSEEEAAIWEGALAHYREEVAGRSLLFDDGLVALRDALAGIGERDALSEGDRETLRHLVQALPVYLRHWWPRHDQENREWVAAVFPDVIRFERQIARRIAAAYGGEWPSPPNRVDLVPYASSTVAYTTGEPHTAVAAVDEESAMPWALELLFHEASHSNALGGRLHAHIEAAYQDSDAEPPRNLWHILLFSIAGEATRDVLEQAGRAYTPLAQQFGIFHRRESDRAIWPLVERHWYPAMARGKTVEEILPVLARELIAAP